VSFSYDEIDAYLASLERGNADNFRYKEKARKATS
jgi:hypothetical protein